MEFSLDQFYRLNRRILIWAALFFLIWLLQDFFALIFMVFVLTFIAALFSRLGRRYLHLPNRAAIILVYAGFLLALFLFVRFVAPQVIREADTLLGNLQQIEVTLLQQKSDLVRRYPSLNPILMGYVRSNIPEKQLSEHAAARSEVHRASAGQEPGSSVSDDDALIVLFIRHQFGRIRDTAPSVLKQLWKASATMLLALLFSFLISLDTERLRQEVESLQVSRLHDFYEQTAQPVVRFGYVVGQALQAQALIAFTNTVLTLVGLLVLGIPNVAVLSLIVFLCSFVPVLGVFLSTTPIVLVALNAAGLGRALSVVGLVVGIHLVEAYVLNPLIYGRQLKLNPVLIVIILFIGHHAFGLWGMLLGVPVAHYLIHDVLGVPLWDRRRLAAAGGLSGPEVAVSPQGATEERPPSR
ncbi:MAG: AI-2E family transporter [Deltaproteobacteria bacterium]|nr:AI-2E family transporter [Deltaproteobacteria bacterium]